MPAVTEIRDSQRATWNRFSKGWKKWDTFVMNWLSPVGETVVSMAKLSPTDQVLDVGSGTGEPGLSAARVVSKGSVLAVDVAEDMLAIAREKSAAAGLNNFSTQHYDGFHLPDGPFDVAIARFGIMFFPDVVSGLKEIKRVIKKGGRFSSSVWQGPTKNPWAAIPGRIVNEILKIQPPAPDAPGIFRCAAPGLTEELFQKAGFVNIKEQEVNGSLTFKDENHFWEYLNDVIAPVVMALSNATPEQKENVRQSIFQAMAPFKTDKGLILPWSAKVTVGEAG